MPAVQAQDKVTWIWDTGEGRHLIGKQALNRKAAACVRRTDSPVCFGTGGGARDGNQTLSFEGSRLLPKDEQVYLLKECPPALSIAKTVIDGGHLFSWDPRENQPYLVSKADVHRCKLRGPRNARINATRVVEYVPQFDEQVQLCGFQTPDLRIPKHSGIRDSLVGTLPSTNRKAYLLCPQYFSIETT